MPNKLELQRQFLDRYLPFTVHSFPLRVYCSSFAYYRCRDLFTFSRKPFTVFCFHSPFTVHRLSFIVYYLSFSNHHLSFFDSLRVKSLIFDSDFLRKAFLIPNLSPMLTNASKGPLNTWLQNRVRPYKMSLFQCIWMVSVICLL